jgi:uncharacterized protein HemY
MKRKLKKDFRFLRSFFVKVILALIIGTMIGGFLLLNGNMTIDAYSYEDELAYTFLGFCSASVLAVLYFFNAWLVGDEE